MSLRVRAVFALAGAQHALQGQVDAGYGDRRSPVTFRPCRFRRSRRGRSYNIILLPTGYQQNFLLRSSWRRLPRLPRRQAQPPSVL